MRETAGVGKARAIVIEKIGGTGIETVGGRKKGTEEGTEGGRERGRGERKIRRERRG